MICFAWSGFPQYAARCISAFVRATDEEVVVLSTRPRVPIKGMERLCGCRVIWIEGNEQRPISKILGKTPRCIFVGGWSIPAFNRFGVETRENGGIAIGMCDHNFTFSFKECLKAVRFRLFIRRKYDGFFVPGNSGFRLLRLYGVPKDKIVKGLYAADSSLFANGLPLADRKKEMIYVGQFIERKNVRRLVEAFAVAAKEVGGEWSLNLYGSGVLKEEMIRLAAEKNRQLESCNSQVRINDFVQPEQLAGLYQEARAFCLPSLWEHWGLVVHEAALSGCVLLLGDKTGAGEDLLVKKATGHGFINGCEFDPENISEMITSFVEIMRMSDDELAAAQNASLSVANSISIDLFVTGVKTLVSIRENSEM